MEEQSAFGAGEKRKFETGVFLLKLKRNWYWILASVLLFMAAAYCFLRYSTPIYQVIAFLQIRSNEVDNTLGATPFTPATRSDRNIPDVNGEIFKLQSSELIGKLVDSLQLQLQLTEQTGVKHKPVFLQELPFSISVKKDPLVQNRDEYKLSIGASGYELQAGKKTYNGIFGSPLIVATDTFYLSAVTGLPVKKTYLLHVLTRQQAIRNCQAKLQVAPMPKGGSGMLQVAMSDELPQRARRMAEVLIHEYDYVNFLFKNKALQSEMAFLDQRLEAVDKELESQENYVKNFKVSNKVNDVSSSAAQLLVNLSGIDTRRSENEYKESLLRLVELNLESGKAEERINVPGLQDADLQGLVAKYNDLVFQKNDILSQGTSRDLRLEPVNARLAETRQHIIRRVAAIRQELRANDKFLQSQQHSTENKFVVLPEKEKNYIQVNRLLNIKQTLLVFLLQRKEDKNMEFASAAMAGSRIVDWRTSRVQGQGPYVIYSAGFAIGLILPVMLLLVTFLVNKKIETATDIYAATKLPVAGEIIFVKSNGMPPVWTEHYSPLAEQFRTLRTNVAYLNKSGSKKLFLVTSTVSGEGKSFISLNLAKALAMVNKKVVLLEFDLRNPCLSDVLGYREKPGVAELLAGNATVEQVDFLLPDHASLHFIPAGNDAEGNAAEMLMSDHLPNLFAHLRMQFDYIIIDSPPIEAVSDALNLGSYCDATLFVVRHQYTLRSSIARLNQMATEQKLPAPAIVINGIRPKEGFNDVLGYGYGYGYHRKAGRKKQKLRIA
ncbi:exopolysaccharide transport family protein [Pseudoflavitalea rhizosphaerae]|uniref:exopolysaccharide transport family protein n=1 Tax=Pseudoflavitalea rhizosphaerae TaxID=1884793 RepID=UPI000F8C4E15|nr:tyrosine-protein kinase family protein [Pseudoflavitalea rhizosphaerae]